MNIDPQKEPVIVVDEQDNQLAIMERDIAEADNDNIIRYVYVLLFNSENEILLQKRGHKIKRYPDHWELSATGAVWEGEGYVQAAERKLPDELNMVVPLFHEHKSRIAVPGKADRMTAVFIGYVEDNKLVQPNREKVDEVRWVDVQEAESGYLLTPSCEEVLKWWKEHGQDIMEEVKQDTFKSSESLWSN